MSGGKASAIAMTIAVSMSLVVVSAMSARATWRGGGRHEVHDSAVTSAYLGWRDVSKMQSALLLSTARADLASEYTVAGDVQGGAVFLQNPRLLSRQNAKKKNAQYALQWQTTGSRGDLVYYPFSTVTLLLNAAGLKVVSTQSDSLFYSPAGFADSDGNSFRYEYVSVTDLHYSGFQYLNNVPAATGTTAPCNAYQSFDAAADADAIIYTGKTALLWSSIGRAVAFGVDQAPPANCVRVATVG